MLYAKLVARISEVTRTLILRGTGGRFEANSAIFTTEHDIRADHDISAGWLRITSGEGRGTYKVVRVVGCDLHVADPFMFGARDVEWELYDRGVSEDDVRSVLKKLPDVLMELDENEQVKTYLGVIKIVRRKRKRVKDPQGRWTFSPERLQARLRPGKRLQRLLEDDPSGASTSSSEDEDPTV